MEINGSAEKTRVLLTGATGTVGRAVLAQLDACSGPVAVTVFCEDTRIARRHLKHSGTQARVVFGDITDKDSVARACKGIDVALHLAALIPPAADNRPDLAHRINVGGTANLIAGLKAHSPGTFLLYASSISVYGDRLQKPDIRVGDPLTASMGDEYARTKIAAEALVRDSGLSWSIFRLTAIMGGHALSPLMFHMPLNTVMEIASPADTARAFVNAVDNSAVLSGRVFNLGGGPRCRITYRQFLNRSFAMLGLGRADFPDGAFATRNFHCGAFADGGDLEEILRFRRDTLEDYFAALARSTPGWRKCATRILRRSVMAHLLRQSEPWRAWRGKGSGRERFFGPVQQRGARADAPSQSG